MENKLFIEEINKRYGNNVLNITEHNRLRVTVSIKPDILVEATQFLHGERKFRFITASGIHSKQGFEILYHYSNDASGHVINLHVILPHEKPEIESLTGVFSAAGWIEREIHELLGIQFKGHPNLVPLLSEDNWPEGTYPYRKNFK